MSGMDVRKMSNSLLKGIVKGMGPLGLPAEILLDTVDALIDSQKKETAGENGPTIDQISQAVREEVRKEAAREAWAKIQTACATYLEALAHAGPGKVLRPSDRQEIDDLVENTKGGKSQLQEGLLQIYNAQMSPSDLDTAQYAFPIYSLGASVELSLMILGLQKKAQRNGSIDAGDWTTIGTRVREHIDATQRMKTYIQSYVIEKQLREEMELKKWTFGDPRIGQRHEELETILLGGPGAAFEILRSLDSLEDAVRKQSVDDVIAKTNKMLQERHQPA